MYNEFLSSLSSRALSLKKAEAALRSINAVRNSLCARDILVAEMHSNGCSIQEIAALRGITRGDVRAILGYFTRMFQKYEKSYWEQDKRAFGNQVLKRSGWHPIDYAVWSESLGVSERRFERFKEAVHKRGAWVFEELEAAKKDPKKSPRRKLLVEVTDNLIGMDAYQKLVDAAGLAK